MASGEVEEGWQDRDEEAVKVYLIRFIADLPLRRHVQTIFGKINVIMGGLAYDSNFFVGVLLSFC